MCVSTGVYSGKNGKMSYFMYKCFSIQENMGVLINGMLEVCVNIVISVNDRRKYVCVIQVYQDSTDGLINGKTSYVINLC